MRILFVCLGNICRSPTAEAVVRHMSEGRLDVDSAGTERWNVGKAPYGPAISAAAQRGYDLDGLRARQVAPADFERYDLIVAMDEENVADIEAIRPPGNQTPARLFLDFAPETGRKAVPDPYYTRDFEEALDLIEAASRGLLATV
ncbi:MAG: low molecular weight protein-tyrosine-phosphatase [Pseudomonadota bacterium]